MTVNGHPFSFSHNLSGLLLQTDSLARTNVGASATFDAFIGINFVDVAS